jgi:hypothetical protein
MSEWPKNHHEITTSRDFDNVDEQFIPADLGRELHQALFEAFDGDYLDGDDPNWHDAIDALARYEREVGTQ